MGEIHHILEGNKGDSGLGFLLGDLQVREVIREVASGCGNFLFNIGDRLKTVKSSNGEEVVGEKGCFEFVDIPEMELARPCHTSIYSKPNVAQVFFKKRAEVNMSMSIQMDRNMANKCFQMSVTRLCKEVLKILVLLASFCSFD